MRAAEVMRKHHQLVPFPVTRKKIEAAGYDFKQYVSELIDELRKCDDAEGINSELLAMILKEKRRA